MSTTTAGPMESWINEHRVGWASVEEDEIHMLAKAREQDAELSSERADHQGALLRERRLADELARVTAQRDALVGALEAIIERAIDPAWGDEGDRLDGCIRVARAAIAMLDEARGGKR